MVPWVQSEKGSSSTGWDPSFDVPDLFPYHTLAGGAAAGPVSSCVGSAGRPKSSDHSQASDTGKAPARSTVKEVAVEKGRCGRCGIKTHTVSVFSRPLTTSDVYKGRCIRCNPVLVPWAVRNEWEIQNAALLVQDEVGSVILCSQEVRGFSGKDHPGRQSNLGASLDQIETDMEKRETQTERRHKEATATIAPTKPIKHTNRCSGCGVRTHKNILGRRFPVTTATVFEGHCIKCAPFDVPLGVLQKWQCRSLGHNAKKIPDTLDVLFDMENPSIPSAWVKPAHVKASQVATTREAKYRSSRKEREEKLTGELLMEQIVAAVSTDNGLGWTSLDKLITKPATVSMTGDAGAAPLKVMSDDKKDASGFLPPTSVVGVPVAKEIKAVAFDDVEIQIAEVSFARNVVDESGSSYGYAAGSDASGGDAPNNAVVYASEVQPLATRKGYCRQCGEVKTHLTLPYSNVRIPITNSECHKGRCLHCHPVHTAVNYPSPKSRRTEIAKRFRSSIHRSQRMNESSPIV